MAGKIYKSESEKTKIKIFIAFISLLLAVTQILQVFVFTAQANESDEDLENFESSEDYESDEFAESDLDFYVAVDYYAEKIRILNPNSLLARYGVHDYMEIFDNESVLGTGIGKSDLAQNISVANNGEYMYALKAVSDETLASYRPQRRINALLREKWYPVYGGGIDISKVIPARAAKNPRRQYYIAIRRTDDVFDSVNGYASRIIVMIKPRYSQRDLNKFIEYDAAGEKIVLSQDYPDGDSLDIVYRYDFFDDLSGRLTKDRSEANANISVSGGLFYMGGNVNISSMPFTKNGQYGPEVVYARSKEVKFKIPATPAMPAIRADLTAQILTSIKKDSLEWSLTGLTGENSGAWQPYGGSETSLPFTEILQTFHGLGENNTDQDGNYAIYFRIKSVEKKSPASMPKKILIPAELVG